MKIQIHSILLQKLKSPLFCFIVNLQILFLEV